MADDAGLLAAQAAGGIEGANVYRQAQLEMETRRAAAVSSAMTAGQARGAPGSAITSVLAESAPGSIDRASAMGQAATSFEGDMRRRQQRAQQYGEQVEGARGLIGDQARAATSKIDAETRAQLALIGAKQAYADAQARAAAAKEAALSNKLNQTQATAAMSAAAQEYLAGLTNAARTEMGQLGQEQSQSATALASATARAQQAATKPYLETLAEADRARIVAGYIGNSQAAAQQKKSGSGTSMWSRISDVVSSIPQFGGVAGIGMDNIGRTINAAGSVWDRLSGGKPSEVVVGGNVDGRPAGDVGRMGAGGSTRGGLDPGAAQAALADMAKRQQTARDQGQAIRDRADAVIEALTRQYEPIAKRYAAGIQKAQDTIDQIRFDPDVTTAAMQQAGIEMGLPPEQIVAALEGNVYKPGMAQEDIEDVKGSWRERAADAAAKDAKALEKETDEADADAVAAAQKVMRDDFAELTGGLALADVAGKANMEEPATYKAVQDLMNLPGVISELENGAYIEDLEAGLTARQKAILRALGYADHE